MNNVDFIFIDTVRTHFTTWKAQLNYTTTKKKVIIVQKYKL